LAGAGRAGFLATEDLGFLLMLRAYRGVARAIETSRQWYWKCGVESRSGWVVACPRAGDQAL
jgi:hypothetical protein